MTIVRTRRGMVLLGWLLAVLIAACSGADPLPPQDLLAGQESLAQPPDTGAGQEGEESVNQRSFAGTVRAPEFPAGLDWLNTEGPLTLAQLRGKVVILDFWTYGCINCIHVIPELRMLETEYPRELMVIGVHSAKFTNEGDTDNIRQIVLRYDRDHPVVNDSDFRVWNLWGVRAWPTLFIVDPAGNIAAAHSGEGIYPLFKPVVDSLVQEFDAKGVLDRTPLDLRLEEEGLPETVLSFPGKVLADPDGGRLFISDTNHNRLVIADIESGEVLEIIGSGGLGFEDGTFRTARFADPQGTALSEDGRILYIADTENHSIRRADLEAGEVTTLLGTGSQAREYPPAAGTAPSVALNSPWDLALDGDRLYIAMAGSHQLWVMDLATGTVDPFAGNGRESTRNGALRFSELAQPSGLALDGAGRLYFADSESSSIRWAGTVGTDPYVHLLVGADSSLFDFGDLDGVGNQARLQHPLGVSFHDGYLYVADTYNSKIKRVEPESQEIETILGGPHGWQDGTDPLFYEPGGIDIAGGTLYVADTNNHTVRIVDLATGETSTLVLKGIQAFASSPEDGEYFGKIVRLDRMDLAPGSGTVRVGVALPEGYKVNPEAPSSMAWTTQGQAIELPDDADWMLAGPTLPVDMAVTFLEGEGLLVGDLALIYCDEKAESLCFIERVRLEAPFRVVSGAGSILTLSHTVELPDIALGSG